MSHLDSIYMRYPFTYETIGDIVWYIDASVYYHYSYFDPFSLGFHLRM